MHQNERRTRLFGAVGEGVEQGKNTGVGKRDSHNKRSRNGEGDDKSDEQTTHVRPTFLPTQRLAIDGYLSGLA